MNIGWNEIPASLDRAWLDVARERGRQDSKWGDQTGKGLVRELDAPAGRFVLTDAAIAALDRDPYTVDPTAQDVEA